MYFPYLRGKQFELDTLLEAPGGVYHNTLPILEPVTLSRRGKYQKLAEKTIPFILLTNPYHPQNNRLSKTQVQILIDNELSTHTALTLGFILDERFNILGLRTFLSTNTKRNKALIFRISPSTHQLDAIKSELDVYSVDYIIFDNKRCSITVLRAFSTHPRQVLITDGFQKRDRNLDYPSCSSFESNFDNWRSDGWYGIGDFLTIGDHFTEGGGQGYVVTLHITVQTHTGLEVHHFSSKIHSSTRGLTPIKFKEANELLVNSSTVASLVSHGIEYYRDWNQRSHSAQLGAAKKASMIHHMELLSGII